MREPKDILQLENYDYQYAFRNVQRQICREKLDAFKSESGGLTLKETMTSDTLAPYVPQVFTDEIILTGQREAIARNLFPTVPQSSGEDEFSQRFVSRSDGAGIYFEMDEIMHTGYERDKETFSIKKIADWPLASWEMLQNSPFSEAALQVALAASKIYRRENQLMAHMLTTYTSGTHATKWDNHENDSVGTSSPELIEAMEDAYLSVTTRVTDRLDPGSLTWLISPSTYIALFKDDQFRRYDILGQTPNFLTGVAPSLFRVPYVIWEPGYFAKGSPSSVWVPTNDVFLASTRQAAAIREKVSLRTEPVVIERIQASGPMMWERLGMYVRNPLAIRRISGSATYSDLQPMKDIRIKPKIED